MTIKLPKAAKPMIDFAIHVAIGTGGFLVVLLAAVTISGVERLAVGLVPEWVRIGADKAEVALFALDLFLFALFVIKEAVTLIRSLWTTGEQDD
jgi:hypothetical protein